MSTTKNVKDIRQIVSAIFSGPEVIFKIPYFTNQKSYFTNQNSTTLLNFGL